MKETIQDVLQLILQADDIKYVKNSGILNYGLDLKQVVEREIELSVCKGDKEILLAMNYDIEQCSVQFQIVDCTEEEEKKKPFGILVLYTTSSYSAIPER